MKNKPVMTGVRKEMDFEFVNEFIRNSSPETKIYIGADSARVKIKGVWYADYTTVVVVHIDGKHGCRVFGRIEREVDYDKRKDHPSVRLLTESYKITPFYLKLKDAIGDRHCEIHLDLNPAEKEVSNIAVAQATGYIRGSCNIVPLIKPQAFAATYGADRFAEMSQRAGDAAKGVRTLSAARYKKQRRRA